jgi:hypothetical protein
MTARKILTAAVVLFFLTNPAALFADEAQPFFDRGMRYASQKDFDRAVIS